MITFKVWKFAVRVDVDAHMCCVLCMLMCVCVCVCTHASVRVCTVCTHMNLCVCLGLLSVSHAEAEGRSTRPRRLQGSGPEDLLGQVARQRVEKQGEEEQQQEEQQEFEEQPAVGVPQEVAGRLERVQEPDEACVGPTGALGRADKYRETTGGWGGAWRETPPPRESPPAPSLATSGVFASPLSKTRKNLCHYWTWGFLRKGQLSLQMGFLWFRGKRQLQV